jgi:ribosomal protein S18 acetylase RimI-like enzyme
MLVRPLLVADIEPAAAILVAAFFDYPVWRWIVPDEAERRALLPDYMRVQVRYGLLEGHAYGAIDDSGGLRGVAIWETPHGPEGPRDFDPDGTLSGYDALRPRLTDAMMRKFEAMVALQRPARAAAMGGPSYWYLPWLGVDPTAQRSGAGRALLDDMFARLDASGAACVLETENEVNVAYYEQRGFRLAHHGTLPMDGPDFWTFARP